MGLIETYVREYGLFALFFASAVEGDLTLLFAGLLVHLGVLDGVPAVLVGASGLLSADLFFFWLGHRTHHWRSKHADELVSRASGVLDRYGALSLLLVRLFYGLRNATMFLVGRRRWRLSRFVVQDLLGVIGWSVLLIAVGYLFSSSLVRIFGHVQRLQRWFLISAVAFVVILFTWRRVACLFIP